MKRIAAIALIAVTGCTTSPNTAPTFSSRFAQVTVINSTNVHVQVRLNVDGGATVIPQVGLAAGDQAISNLATVAKDAYETSTGVGAASGVVQGLGSGLLKVEAIKASK